MPSNQPVIYRSDLPPTSIIQKSIFTYLMDTTYYEFKESSPAFVDASTGITITRGKIKQLALRLGYGLRFHLALPGERTQAENLAKLSRGDTVMIIGENTMSWPTTVFACLAAGFRITFAGHGLTARELSWQWLDSKACVVFATPQTIDVVKEMFNLLRIPEAEASKRIWVMDQLWDENLPKGDYQIQNWLGDLLDKGTLGTEERFDGGDADETAYICYSSGTTGRPKGVETTHKNVCTIMRMCKSIWAYVETENDVQLGLMPFYHIFGLIMHLNYPFMTGQPCILMLQGFQPEAVCRNIERFKVTTIMLAPPIILELSTHPGIDKYDMTSLKCIASAAAPLSPVVAERLLARLAERGADVKLIQGCGSTETTCPAQMVLPPDHRRKFGSIGKLMPNLELRLVEENEDGVTEPMDVEEGEPGEMWVRGPTIMKGYLNNPEATARSFAPGGWYKTGDIMRRDKDGYYYIVDRKKELIKYKGFQVAPAELEAILLENTSIADVGVIGVHVNHNELPRAYVVPSDPLVLQWPNKKVMFERDIQKWMESQVAYYKRLRGGVIAVPEIPKSSSGKILRKELREWAKMELGKTVPSRL